MGFDHDDEQTFQKGGYTWRGFHKLTLLFVRVMLTKVDYYRNIVSEIERKRKEHGKTDGGAMSPLVVTTAHEF